jgi:pyruvate dehydrogenase E1 component beta subunit
MATIDMTVRDAINHAIDEEMARDEKVFVIGNTRSTLYRAISLINSRILNKQGKRLLNTKAPTKLRKVCSKNMAKSV